MESRFDFERYVELKKSPTARKTQRGGFGEYAYSALNWSGSATVPNSGMLNAPFDDSSTRSES